MVNPQHVVDALVEQRNAALNAAAQATATIKSLEEQLAAAHRTIEDMRKPKPPGDDDGDGDPS